MGRGHTVFNADPVGIGITLSCLHNILWNWLDSYQIFMDNWDIHVTKNWLDFGDLIFKVTAVEKLKIHSEGTEICFSFSLKTLLLVLHENMLKELIRTASMSQF